MTTITITSETAHKWCRSLAIAADRLGENSGQVDAMRDELKAALSAPAGPLTADECRAFAERCRKLESKKVSLVSDAMRACYSLDMLALQLEDANAPAWTGPQPVADGQITEQENH